MFGSIGRPGGPVDAEKQRELMEFTLKLQKEEMERNHKRMTENRAKLEKLYRIEAIIDAANEGIDEGLHKGWVKRHLFDKLNEITGEYNA